MIGFLFFWIGFSVVVAVAAGTRGRNPAAWFGLALLLSPLLAGLLVLALPPVDHERSTEGARETGATLGVREEAGWTPSRRPSQWARDTAPSARPTMPAMLPARPRRDECEVPDQVLAELRALIEGADERAAEFPELADLKSIVNAEIEALAAGTTTPEQAALMAELGRLVIEFADRQASGST